MTLCNVPSYANCGEQVDNWGCTVKIGSFRSSKASIILLALGLPMDWHARTIDHERWQQLCKLAEQETDPNRLLDLANKILEMLDQKYDSLTKRKLQ